MGFGMSSIIIYTQTSDSLNEEMTKKIENSK